jgi:hypothetical protein
MIINDITLYKAHDRLENMGCTPQIREGRLLVWIIAPGIDTCLELARDEVERLAGDYDTQEDYDRGASPQFSDDVIY